jgi:Holliday junction resolvase RusA-like endonuclease
MIEASKYLPAWRKAVTLAAVDAMADVGWVSEDSAAQVTVTFYVARPATVKIADRPYPIKPPDVDKLGRGVLDALSDAGVWGDDAQCVKLTVMKFYADMREPGAVVEVVFV